MLPTSSIIFGGVQNRKTKRKNVKKLLMICHCTYRLCQRRVATKKHQPGSMYSMAKNFHFRISNICIWRVHVEKERKQKTLCFYRRENCETNFRVDAKARRMLFPIRPLLWNEKKARKFQCSKIKLQRYNSVKRLAFSILLEKITKKDLLQKLMEIGLFLKI